MQQRILGILSLPNTVVDTEQKTEQNQEVFLHFKARA